MSNEQIKLLKKQNEHLKSKNRDMVLMLKDLRDDIAYVESHSIGNSSISSRLEHLIEHCSEPTAAESLSESFRMISQAVRGDAKKLQVSILKMGRILKQKK